MKLIQKSGLKRKEFEFLNNGELIVKEKRFLKTTEFSVNIEHIGTKKHIESHSRTGLKIVASFFFLIAFSSWIALFFEEKSEISENILLAISGLFIFGLGVSCFYAPLNNFLTLHGGQVNIQFFLDSPSRQNVEDFADRIIKISKEKIKKKYTRIDPDIPEDVFMQQLHWLLNNDYINEQEYAEKKNDYKISKLTR